MIVTVPQSRYHCVCGGEAEPPLLDRTCLPVIVRLYPHLSYKLWVSDRVRSSAIWVSLKVELLLL